MRKLINSFALGFKNIQSHLLHTLLSVLGVVIGVAALVGILSLIDSFEQYGKAQIARTTSLEKVFISTIRQAQIAGTWVKKEKYAYLTYPNFSALHKAITLPKRSASLFVNTASTLKINGLENSVETLINAINGTPSTNVADSIFLCGQMFTDDQVLQQAQVAVVNEGFAKKIIGTGELKSVLGKELIYQGNLLKIIGISRSRGDSPEIFVPITLLADSVLRENTPQCIIEATRVEDVAPLKREVEAWLKANFQTTANDFKIFSYENRVEQATNIFLIAKIIAGMIVGISVLVGGIGIMNVLLISVTERTVEIGIQKAVGAKKSDITMQFLAESLCISFMGSSLGLILGVLGTLAVTPLVSILTPVKDFHAHFTFTTLSVVGIVAVVIGIIFGTYPAIKAANLNPVEAIRRE